VELVLALHEKMHIRVTCDDHSSHVADLHPLLFQNEQDIVNDPVAYGKKLYAALFPSNTLAQQALAEIPERLLLVASDPQLDAIPWEYVYGSFGSDDPASPDYSENFLVLECPFVRGLLPSQRIAPPTLDQSLHIIAVPSNPLSDTIEPLAIDAEWTRLKESIQQVSSAITLERTTPPTLERVRHFVANQKGRVVHFMGHGGQDQQQGAVLCFEQDNGALHLVTAKEFMQRVRGTIFLVTLNACVSATPGPTSFHSLASALVRQKTPYALGMRLSIVDEDARTFSRVFYNELARGVPVEEALFQSRLTLAKSQRSWVVGVPVLYTSLPEAAPGFVNHDGTPTVKDNSSHVDVSVLPPVEGAFQGRINDLITLGTVLTGDQRPRILTILGSGGQGKTALALKLVERFAFAWPGGVWAIALDHLPDRSTFIFALAQFLGIETQKTLESTDIEPLVLAPLKERRTLLVLDNAETLIEAVEAHNAEALDLVAFLKKLLGTLAYLLVTSRVPLSWDDEHTYELEGLSPEEGAALFRQGAPQRRGEIDLSVAVSLSRQLEGHPLGLRLLAGAFNEIEASLPTFLQTTMERLREAENKYVGPEHRHRKLYACIETSVRSLDPAVRSLLSGLWIFQAPFLADTTVAIFDPDTQETEQNTSPVRDQLYQLQRRSLLTRKTVTTRDGTLRLYALSPTTRPYIEHYLKQAYDHEILRKRLITAYLHLARLAYNELNRSAMVVAFVQRGREDFEWVCEALEDEEMTRAEKSWYLLYWGWIVYRLGNSLRGLRLLEQAKEMIEGTDSTLTLQISNNMALVYRDTGQPQKALQLYEQALPSMREVGDRAGEASTLNNMALVYRDTGQPQKALQLYEQALPIRREVGDRVGEASTLSNMAEVYRATGQPQKALQLYEQALPIRREVGDRAGEASTLNNMALVYHATGQPQKALQLYEQALPIMREVGDRAGEASTLNNMAGVYYATGQPQKALQLYEQALPSMREVGDRAGEASTLNNMAGVYRATGQPQKALQLYEQALPIRREVGDRAGEAATLNGLAYLYQSLQRYSEAATAFEQSIDLERQVIHPAGEIAGLIGLAFLFYQPLNRPADAILSLEQALQVFVATGLSHDAAGQTVEDIQQWLARMRDENILEAPSTLPVETIQQIVNTTIAVTTRASEHHSEWHERINQALQDAQQRGVDWQPERDFYATILAILDGQFPAFPPDHPYAQAIEAIQKGIAAGTSEQIDTSPLLMQAIREFLNAEDWDATRRVVEAQHALLFQPEVENIFVQNIEQAKAKNNERVADLLEVHLALLRECQKNGIVQAFEHLLSIMQPEEEPAPFAPELIPRSIHALKGGTQEKMAHVQYLAALSTETTDEPLKALINVIQLALFGGDPSQLGQNLEGVYRQAWETILAGLTPSGDETI
jgi:tetratricopeptide (TPR) repeat protein